MSRDSINTGANSTQDGKNPGGEKPPEKRYHCDLCGAPMLDLHCKLICRCCGFKRDCSDP